MKQTAALFKRKHTFEAVISETGVNSANSWRMCNTGANGQVAPNFPQRFKCKKNIAFYFEKLKII